MIPPSDKSLRLREKARFWYWVVRHLWRPGNPNETLVSELRDIFGSLTLGELFEERGIGLCVTATAFLQHKPRVFKTPHREQKQRDNGLLVADACLASSAAPIYLPMASITADGLADQVYADGGLWANNPVLLGMIEGLAPLGTGAADRSHVRGHLSPPQPDLRFQQNSTAGSSAGGRACFRWSWV